MAVTLISVKQVGPSLMQAQWSSDAMTPTFYVYVNGELAGTTNGTIWQAAAAPGEQIVFEIFDTPSHTTTPVPTGRVTLSWYRVEDAEAYRIDRLIAGEWTEQATINTADWFNSWVSPVLEDSTHHAFRIVPLIAGSEGEPTLAWRFIVRHPDIPQVTFEYQGPETRLVTVEAAA